MKQIVKYSIILASLMTVELIADNKDIGDKYKYNIERPYYPVFINVCDISDRRSKVHCYCDSPKPKQATRADCWVFNGGIAEDDPIWPSFSSQSLLEELIFNVRSDGALTFIPAKAIVRLDNLKFLSIQYGTIKIIPPYAFTNSSTLREIMLKSNKITNLERHSFAQMMMLSNLSLDENQISELRREVFFALPNLHILHMSNNNLSLIHEGCFKHLNNLIELRLGSNLISVVTREMLEGLENLSRLDLRNNKLTMVGNLAFSELWSLKELILDNNGIEFISERAFGGLSQLRKLSLSGNKLTTFYEDILEDMRSVVVLDLSYNQLETISYETIRPVIENDKTSSTSVYLDGNPFTCDCRLSWIYVLRNETKDSNLKTVLERVSCITDPTLDRRMNKETDDSSDDSEINQVDNKVSEDSYEDYNENKHYELSDNLMYDDPTQTDTVDIEVKSIKLTEISVDLLPCPKELMQSMEETYGHPVQNEIRLKAFSKADIAMSHSSLKLLSLFLLLLL